MKKRPYRLRKRAEQQQETRERIVDAAIALHEEIGPAATTISALAERAGVQRLTVYRHFASEQEILQACSTKWLARHPPPDLATLPPGPPAERVHAILLALYGYYARTQGMWRSVYRDLGQLETLAAPMQVFEDYLATVGDAILAACGTGRSRRLRATVAHALRFSTWHSLDAQGLGPGSMAELVCGWIEATAAGRA
jgi:AcrR family transcriptional regulator